eukprot:NODE_681_length_4794_cov_0.887114.p5 type:complete len:149 gc:universal NODE_681_length_4794_cov_0.887114:3739-4185(+)
MQVPPLKTKNWYEQSLSVTNPWANAEYRRARRSIPSPVDENHPDVSILSLDSSPIAFKKTDANPFKDEEDVILLADELKELSLKETGWSFNWIFGLVLIVSAYYSQLVLSLLIYGTSLWSIVALINRIFTRKVQLTEKQKFIQKYFKT